MQRAVFIFYCVAREEIDWLVCFSSFFVRSFLSDDFLQLLDESEEEEQDDDDDDEEKRSHPYIRRPSNGYVPILFVSHAETCHKQSERGPRSLLSRGNDMHDSSSPIRKPP